MSYDLQWILLRNNNSFLVRKAAGGPILSREPGNILNIHSQRLSPLVNAKAVAIEATETGVAIVTKDATKNPRAIAASLKTVNLKAGTSARKAANIASGAAGKTRPDLRKAAVARASTLVRATKPAKSPKQASRTQKKAEASA